MTARPLLVAVGYLATWAAILAIALTVGLATAPPERPTATTRPPTTTTTAIPRFVTAGAP